jgi:outer membrane protein OmpA-like peptidoglycan-associated protein
LAQSSSASKENTSTTSFATSKSSQEKDGDKSYFVFSFDKAIVAYKKSNQLTVDGQRKLAKSYHNMFQDKEAEAAYYSLVNTSEGNEAEDYYNYAMVLKYNGKYDEANKQLTLFESKKPNDLRAVDFMTNKSKLSTMLANDGKFTISHPAINTDAKDFGPSYFKNSIVFASSRSTKVNPKKSNRSGKPFLTLYESQLINGEMKTPIYFDTKLNNAMNDGPASFNKEGTFMAFTQNNYDLTSKELVVKLQLYFRIYKDGKWQKAEPFALNSKAYSVGHPSLSYDGNTMYFASDMPGGYGGVDLYRTTKTSDGNWTTAQNLGTTINTEGDEMFPYYEDQSKTLFFSSNGKYGLGGLDIYYTKANAATFETAVNAGAPLNSQYDDFAAIVDNKMQKGYFSSNRAGGSGDDDIYMFTINDIQKRIQGVAKNNLGIAAPYTFVKLSMDKSNTTDTVTTDKEGNFSFNVEANKNYMIVGKNNKYADADTMTNTFGKEFVVKADLIFITKEEKIKKQIKPGADLGKIANFETIYFDLDKYNIRSDAAKILDKIVIIINQYPTMEVALGAYTDCRETKAYNQILSDKRANATSDYIKKRITNPNRITSKGYGKTKIVNGCNCDGDVISDCTESQHQQNRRTEFIIVSK